MWLYSLFTNVTLLTVWVTVESRYVNRVTFVNWLYSTHVKKEKRNVTLTWGHKCDSMYILTLFTIHSTNLQHIEERVSMCCTALKSAPQSQCAVQLYSQPHSLNVLYSSKISSTVSMCCTALQSALQSQCAVQLYRTSTVSSTVWLLRNLACGGIWMYGSSMWDMTHSYETWLIYMRHDSCIWNMTHSYEIWLIYRKMTHSYGTWLIHMRYDTFMCDMTHSCETWLIHIRHDLFIWDMTGFYETWLIHIRYDSFIWNVTH